MISGVLSAFARARTVPSRGWKTGVHTSRGGFRVLPSMLPRYLVPDLAGFKLGPYVANYAGQQQARRGGAAAAAVAAGQQRAGLADGSGGGDAAAP
ncbi:hypothetical protein Rsub_11070 [Raphidocelis subcapitata]|uniref:Uncharacterized protein n=1 Tax=Raphidocelis subcapitata TaxID=307507 RepID=A0A2V0PK17_9CHLO|nr:hypothetical protein Rsub_11070 [Raphidocelis subcapitata]|eukprot:GBF98250.1 hypothetical protein Rsub_11070 [Raphidocelis subcapitata]